MQSSHQNSSEVARILQQIEEEYVAARRGLTGLAECARHAFITARMENIGRLHERLQVLVGDQAMPLLCARLEREGD